MSYCELPGAQAARPWGSDTADKHGRETHRRACAHTHQQTHISCQVPAQATQLRWRWAPGCSARVAALAWVPRTAGLASPPCVQPSPAGTPACSCPGSTWRSPTVPTPLALQGLCPVLGSQGWPAAQKHANTAGGPLADPSGGRGGDQRTAVRPLVEGQGASSKPPSLVPLKPSSKARTGRW